MSADSARNRFWKMDALGGAAVVAILAGSYFTVVRPVMERDAPIRRLLTDLNQRDREAGEVEAQVTRAAGRLAALDVELESAVRLLPADRVNQRLVDITARAQARGLSIEQMTPGPAAALGRVVGVPVRIAGKGSYPDLLAFARELALEHRDWAITGLEISGPPTLPADPGSQNTYQIDFVWYAAPAASAGAPEGE